MQIAICPGSFDPVTRGHMDIITRACHIFDKVIVAVSVNPQKTTSFSAVERIKMLEIAAKSAELTNVEIDNVNGLLADYAREKNANVIVKGLRAMTDFEYEFQMALTNKQLNPDLETMFLATSSQYMFLSSSMVKQVAGFGGDIKDFVPECIAQTITERLSTGGSNNG